MSSRRPDHPAPDTLDAALADVWAQLQTAADSAKHGFHLPTLATVATDGTPRSRIVVLRAADLESRAVVAHTDRRSPKVLELAQQKQSSWTFYDADRRIQARVAGPTEVLTDGPLVEQRWLASSLSSRRCYLAPAAPGTACDTPSPNLPEHVRDRVPDPEETEPGRANFAVIRTVATSIDVLYLHHAGHRRAAFSWNAPDDPAPTHTTWLEV